MKKLTTSLFDRIEGRERTSLSSLHIVSRRLGHKDSTAERILRKLAQFGKIETIYDNKHQVTSYVKGRR